MRACVRACVRVCVVLCCVPGRFTQNFPERYTYLGVFLFVFSLFLIGTHTLEDFLNCS